MADHYPVTQLIAFAAALLARAGLDEEKAQIVAETLVEGDLLGHNTHGLALLAGYLADIEKGAMSKTGEPRVIADFPAAVTWDGNRLPGPWLVRRRALNLAMERAQKNGTCTVVIRRSHHIACLAAYLQAVAERGFMVMLTCSDPAAKGVAPHGGRCDVITPNPLAAAWPTGGDPVVLDVSMSITTNGLTKRLAIEGKKFPGQWLVDGAGNPTNDPAAAFASPPRRHHADGRCGSRAQGLRTRPARRGADRSAGRPRPGPIRPRAGAPVYFCRSSTRRCSADGRNLSARPSTWPLPAAPRRRGRVLSECGCPVSPACGVAPNSWCTVSNCIPRSCRHWPRGCRSSEWRCRGRWQVGRVVPNPPSAFAGALGTTRPTFALHFRVFCVFRGFLIMEVIFMGTGTSQGVPMIACHCAVCTSTDPRNMRTRASIHVVMDGLHIQVDAAPEFRLQCLRERIEQLDVFILTHGHNDHITGMDDLRRFCDLHGGQALTVHTTDEGMSRVLAMFPYAIAERPVAKGYAAFKLVDMPAVLEFPQGTIHSTLLPHGGINTLGLVFQEKSSGKKFAYYSDCKRIPREAVALARDAEIVCLDGLRPDPHPTHMNIEEACAAAAEIAAPTTYLTHLTHGVDYETWNRKLAAEHPGVQLAFDGLRLKL